MKIKFYFGIALAVFVGLSVGYVFKVGGVKTYLTIQNLIQDKYVTAKNLGGPTIDQIKEIAKFEDFPGNGPEMEYPSNMTEEDFKIPEQGKAILANLDTMKLETYQDGKLVAEYQIISKGRQGTGWETPPGKFQILYKTKNHFSSIGEVWMPYSMQFFGNYFIHGWPYHTDGTPVPEGYSGGCIRVADIEMAQVYEFADVGTTVVIKGKLPKDQEKIKVGEYEIKNNVKFPKISAKAYVVADIDSGQVINAYSQKTVHSIASLSKLMTALVSLETINQYKETMISDRAVSTYGDSGGLKSGDIYSVGELIYPLLLESSNDAAEAIAEFPGRKSFIANMNQKAKSIGLENTSFEDASGLSPNNKSTAQDLFNLTQYIYKYKNYILEISKLKEKKVDEKIWYSNSKFRNDENYIGGKNGYTDEAQHTLITVLELPLGEGENEMRNIAIILLQGQEKEKDIRDIEKYLLSNVYFREK